MRLALIAALLSTPSLAQEDLKKKDRHVIVISIDGLRPEFYLGDGFEAPTIRTMAREGTFAKAVLPAYPSVTYAGHATIVTGVRPARHGIVSNTKFGENGGTSEWFWETKDLQAQPIWAAARAQGRKVAITSWPTTVGADVDWLVPQRWGVFKGEKTWELLLKHSTPGLLMELGLALGIPSAEQFQKKETTDEFIAAGAAYVFAKYKPHLLLVHLIQVDDAEHNDGRDSDAVRKALKRTDQNVAKIRQSVEKAGLGDRTVLLLVGDHGFEDVTESVAPNVLLSEAGLIDLDGSKVKAWRALGHAHGGSMAIYAKDADSARRASEVLERGAKPADKRLYAIVDRRRLDELGYNKDAAFALEAEEGISFVGTANGKLAGHKPWAKGQHGYLPGRPTMATGFVASGPGIRRGTVEKMELVDIAPTVARLLGFEMKDVEGSPLPVME